MLVLTRKLQERIKIGDNVTITVLRVKGNSVRIGIEAPRSVRVVRAELPADGTEEAGASEVASAGEEATPVRIDGGAEGGHISLGESDPPAAPSPLRFPQRRMINRCGSPPLRVAGSQALAASGALS